MTQIKEYLIFIHGVSQTNNKPHDPSYDKLYKGVGKRLEREFPDKQAQWSQRKPCYVEWGWNYDPPAADPQGHRLLAQAQERMAGQIKPLIERARDLTWNPLRFILPGLRDLMLQGFSDIVFYASQDGRRGVRSAVASQILETIGDVSSSEDPISLTFLGHSAGSVVAFDFLFYLFADDSLVGDRLFVEEDPGNQDQFKKLRDLAQAGKLRVRRLITFGSPISMLAFRKNAVLEILADGKKLNPSNYGLTRNPDAFGEPLDGPRWINLWDKDDIISWPIEPLMESSAPGMGSIAQDLYTDVGSLISKTHNAYWKAKKVHSAIAKYW